MHVHTHTQSVSVSQICADYISCCVLGEWAACRVRWPSSAPSKPGPGQQRLPLFVRDQTEKHPPHDNKKYTPLLCSILYILPNQHFAFLKTLSKQKQKKKTLVTSECHQIFQLKKVPGLSDILDGTQLRSYLVVHSLCCFVAQLHTEKCDCTPPMMLSECTERNQSWQAAGVRTNAAENGIKSRIHRLNALVLNPNKSGWSNPSCCSITGYWKMKLTPRERR